MLPILAPEIWLSRFANHLRVLQPAIDDGLALDLAKSLHPMLGWEKPENAVLIILEIQLREYEHAGDLASKALREAQRNAQAASAADADTEAWLTRFAAQLRLVQPVVQDQLARHIAQLVHPMLSSEEPEAAVASFLDAGSPGASADVAAALREMRAKIDGQHDGSGRPSSSA